jgi:protein O-mannosyl-transferase
MGRKSRSKRRQPAELREPKRFEPTAWAGNDKAEGWQAPASFKKWLFAAALVVAVFLAYLPAWRGGFVWDDDLHLLNNPVLKPGGLARIWAPGSYINYWPLTFTAYRLEFETWGLDTLGFHLVNIALHAVTALLVWRVLVELDVRGAMFAAAIFALHPVNVESVAWIAQLKGILSLLFGLISTLFYLTFDRTLEGRGPPACPDRPAGQSPRPWMLYAASITAFCLSSLAKGMVLTLPVVLLACVWWRRGALERRDLVRMLPYVLIGAFMAGVEVWTQQLVHAGDVRSGSLLYRAAAAGCAVWFYVGKLLWPLDLCFIYPRWKIDDGDVRWYLPGLLLAIIFALALWRRRTWGRPVVMLIVCYVALLLPALGFVNIYFMRYSLVADHWQYAAAIVPCAVLAGAAAAWTDRQPGPRKVRPVAYVIVLSLLAVLAGLTWRQSRMYANMETLWNDTIAKDPNSWMAHYNLGNALNDRGQVDEAIDHYRKALDVKPDLAEAHYNLGNALASRGFVDDAIDHFQKAVKIKPDYVEAYINLGSALADRGQLDEAIAHYRNALEIQPNQAAAHYNLAMALARRGQINEAIDHFRTALEIKPDYTEAHNNLAIAHNNLGLVLFDRGQVDEAIDHYRKAVEITPDYVDAYFNLGLALVGRGQVNDAAACYRKALEFKPDLLKAHFNLGLALASLGRRDEALEHYRNALDLASAQNNQALADAIRAQMRLAGNGP